jgi:hypothetical protein
MEQLDRLRSANVSRLRQRCSLEFPEIAKKEWDCGSSGKTPRIQFLAGEQTRQHKAQAKKYESSCAHFLGIDISPHTRRLAKIVLDVEEQLTQTEKDLVFLLESPELAPYGQVLDLWGFSNNMQALLIGKIYPFSKFLRDGKPWIIPKTSKQGRDYERDQSKSLFCAYLGLSKRIEQSGDGLKTIWAGSSLVRSHFYPWFLCTVCPSDKRSTDYRQEVGAKYDNLIESGVKGKDAICRCLYFIVQRIYRDLVKTLV